MSDVLGLKSELLSIVEKHSRKNEFSKTVSDDYYEPGMMENLDQYYGHYSAEKNTILLRTPSAGLRYDNRTLRLNYVEVVEDVVVARDSSNAFNSNNFEIFSSSNASLGYLPAELCNALAPLVDKGYASILSSKISYIERIRDRSRYAKQGVMFVELQIKLRGI